VAASPLRDDGRSGLLVGDRDNAAGRVAARGPAPRGAGDREVDLLVAAVAATPDAPKREDRKNCELMFPRYVLLAFVMMRSSRNSSSPTDLYAFLLL
jgi:hypothetical protein